MKLFPLPERILLKLNEVGNICNGVPGLPEMKLQEFGGYNVFVTFCKQEIAFLFTSGQAVQKVAPAHHGDKRYFEELAKFCHGIGEPERLGTEGINQYHLTAVAVVPNRKKHMGQPQKP